MFIYGGLDPPRPAAESYGLEHLGPPGRESVSASLNVEALKDGIISGTSSFQFDVKFRHKFGI